MKLEGRSEQTDSDSGLLQKLDEAAKSFLYEHFTLQPLCPEYPADAIVDYQMKKVSGQSMDVFDSNLDLMTFPELFPTGRNGMRDSLREVKLGTSEFIESTTSEGLQISAQHKLPISLLSDVLFAGQSPGLQRVLLQAQSVG